MDPKVQERAHPDAESPDEPAWPPVIAIVDDDLGVLRSIGRALGSHGYDVRPFSSSRALLDDVDALAPSCIVVDLLMPGLTGLDVQRSLRESECRCPVIFITGHGDIRTSVRAMLDGAVDFLTKPVDLDDLLDALERAVARSHSERELDQRQDTVRRRAASLTPRERQVLEQVVSGLLNKQIAVNLGISEKTVKVHRSRVMQKMQVRSLPDLVRAAQQLGLDPSYRTDYAPPLPLHPGEAVTGPLELGR